MERGRDVEGWSEVIERADAIAASARSIWYSLLAAGLFCGITLLSIQDEDLFTNRLSLKLPIVDVSIGATRFLLISPILLAALFLYFQSQILKYFLCIAELPPVLDDKATGRTDVPISRFIAPWIVSDAALWLMPNERRDWTEVGSLAATLLLGWLLPSGLILAMWLIYLPSHDFSGSLLLCTLFALTLVVGAMTISRSIYMLKTPVDADARVTRRATVRAGAGIAIAIGAILTTWVATNGLQLSRGDILRIADYSPGSGLQIPRDAVSIPPVWADLTGAQLSQRSDNWVPYQITAQSLFTNRREDPVKRNYAVLNGRIQQIEAVRQTLLGDVNLDYSVLTGAFAVNANIYGASFRNAILNQADLEGVSACDRFNNDECLVSFEGANLWSTKLTRSKLNGVNFKGAKIFATRFLGADLSGADFTDATIVGSPFVFANLQDTRFDGVLARRVIFRWSPLQGAKLSGMEFSGSAPASTWLRDNIGDESTELPFGVSVPTCLLRSEYLNGDYLSAIPHLSGLEARGYYCDSAEELCLAGTWPGEDEGFTCCVGEHPGGFHNRCQRVLLDWNSIIEEYRASAGGFAIPLPTPRQLIEVLFNLIRS